MIVSELRGKFNINGQIEFVHTNCDRIREVGVGNGAIYRYTGPLYVLLPAIRMDVHRKRVCIIGSPGSRIKLINNV